MSNQCVKILLLAASLVGSALVLAPRSSEATESRTTVTFQGRLQVDGQPITSTLDLEFRVYDAQTAGTAMWSEIHSGVVIHQGVVCEVLGNTTSLDDTFQVDQGTSSDRWIAVLYQGNEILVPRVKLSAVPYSINALVSESIWDPSTNSALNIAALDSRYAASPAAIAGDGLHEVAGKLAVRADTTSGGDLAPVTVGANGVSLDVRDLLGRRLLVDVTPIPTEYTVPIGADLNDHFGALGTALGVRANLLGRPGGQVLIGGTDASALLTLQSTAHASRGQIVLSDNARADQALLFTDHTATPSVAVPNTLALYAKQGKLYWNDGTEHEIGAGGGGGGVIVPSTNGGRLTLSSSDPAPDTDQTSKTTLYWLPYRSNLVALYDGSAWAAHTIPSGGVSISSSGLDNDRIYDVFLYDSSGLNLELVAFSDGYGTFQYATRQTALVRQDGVWVKSGDATRRYIGTVYLDSSTQFNDGNLRRLVWNMDNRLTYIDGLVETSYSWSTSGGWEIVGSASDWDHHCVVGLPSSIDATANVRYDNASSSFRLGFELNHGGRVGAWLRDDNGSDDLLRPIELKESLAIGYRSVAVVSYGGADLYSGSQVDDGQSGFVVRGQR